MINDVLNELEAQYEETLVQLTRELNKIRTGRANLAMLDGVRVDYYGTPTPLNQVAAMKVAEPRLITIQPWERNLVNDIERAIAIADLGLNPSNDGVLIRVPIPALTTERRQELTKVARRVGEDHKISMRNQRRDSNDIIKALEKDSSITEDQMHKAFDKVNTLTDAFVKKVESTITKKEAEIMEV